MHLDALYDASNESGLSWWINETIRDFITPTFIRGNPLNACTVRHEGHRPKVLLWIMEEFFHISHSLTDTDHDGCVILCYELMIEVEHCFRIKQGGGMGCTATRRHRLAMLLHAPETSWKTWPGTSLIAKHWSAWCGPSTMEFCRWGPHRNWQAPSPIIKSPGASPVRSSGGSKWTVRHGYQPNLMSHCRSECAQSSLPHLPVAWRGSQRLLRPWT